MESCAIREAALKLQDGFLLTVTTPEIVTRRHEAVEALATDGNRPLEFSLRWIDCSHSYLAERGINPEIARHFGVGCNRGKRSMAGRIVFPIHDENGLLVAHAGRSIDQTEPRYRFPARFRKSPVLFDLHRAVVAAKSVIVVEGFFDCLRAHEAGLPCVVSLMGCSLSLRQEELLCERFQDVTLFLDGDSAGRGQRPAPGFQGFHEA